MDQASLITQVQIRVKDLVSQFETEDYTEAVADALEETGWTLPTTDSFKMKWIRERTIRHLLNMLYLGSSSKFKVDQINLQQKFDHYGELVKRFDTAFEKIQDEEPHQFANVSATQIFGHQLNAGFSSDALGYDTTYGDDNLVIVTPGDAE